jgi:hypothetical protein
MQVTTLLRHERFILVSLSFLKERVERNKGLGDMETATPIVMFHVLDNHGHPDYKCLDRFRVHGYVVPGK